MIDQPVLTAWKNAAEKATQITVMTGAGVSAESNIPTFRGPEGYWTVGSKEYHPQEMATHAMFMQQPYEVWKWYCYRRSVCVNADPNSGHFALVKMEEILQDRFTLITQNVDGLHLRAGNSEERTFQIHGNIHYMRCSRECSDNLYPIPDSIPSRPIIKEFSQELLDQLRCPRCGELARPHVLWFDESYDEKYFRFESSLNIATQTDILLVVGTAGATTLPNHIVQVVLKQGGLVIDINIAANVFGDLAKQNNGYSLQGASGVILPEFVSALQLDC